MAERGGALARGTKFRFAMAEPVMRERRRGEAGGRRGSRFWVGRRNFRTRAIFFFGSGAGIIPKTFAQLIKSAFPSLSNLPTPYSGIFRSASKSIFSCSAVPDFPIRLEVTKAQTPGFLNNPLFEDLRKKCLEEESTADGVVVNTFLELEQLFVENYEKLIGKKVWAIGPICLYNKDFEMNVGRGNKEAIDQRHRVLTWLNSKDAASVLYISFGSIAYTNSQQLMEIGNALEASNKQFIWVIKKIEMKPEVEKWISAGFEERTKDRGLIIVGWAPQMVILSHPAVGGFIMHCGWNSMLEAISMGVPMITWPRFADQFVNEKLVVDFLRIGVSLGVKVPNSNNDTVDVVMVKSDDLRKAVCALMDGGIEADERRQRIKDFSEKAKKAMGDGGSSYINLTDFIRYFTEPEQNKK